MLIIFPDSPLSKTSPLLSDLYSQQTPSLPSYPSSWLTVYNQSLAWMVIYLSKGNFLVTILPKIWSHFPSHHLLPIAPQGGMGPLVPCPLSIGLLTVLVSSGSCAGRHRCGAVSFWVKLPCHVQRTMFPGVLPIVWLSFSFVISHFLRFPESWWGL